jgi:hypothetical protein
VGIFLATNWDQMRDEEVIWLCIAAAASVYLLPRLPAFFASIGRAAIWIVVSLLVVASLVGAFYVSMSVRETQREVSNKRMSITRSVPRPDTSGRFARVSGELPPEFLKTLNGDIGIRNWITSTLPFAHDRRHVEFALSETDGFLNLNFSHGRQSTVQEQQVMEEEQQAIRAAYALAAQSLAPSVVHPTIFAPAPWQQKLADSKPDFSSMETND